MIGKIIGLSVLVVVVVALYYWYGYLPYQKVGTLKIKTVDSYLRAGYTMCYVEILEVSGDTDGIKVGDKIGYPRSTFWQCIPEIGSIEETYVWANGEILQRK